MQQLEDEFYKAGVNQRMTKGCTAITIKHMKGFAEWANDNYYKITETRVWFKDHIQEGTYTTEQLIGKYFEKPNS